MRPCTEPLMLPLNKEFIANVENKEIEYDGVCMNAPKEILYFLMETIEKVNILRLITVVKFLVSPFFEYTFFINAFPCSFKEVLQLLVQCGME